MAKFKVLELVTLMKWSDPLICICWHAVNYRASNQPSYANKGFTWPFILFQEYFTQPYSFVGTFFQSIVLLVGLLGNILVCIVVFKTRSMRTTTNCYLVSLAVADTITLVSSVPQEILSYHIGNNQWVWGSVGCTLLIYLQVRFSFITVF